MPKIRKVPVASGVTWVEVPEAEVYVLCGCPADAVKHLMKRGMILPAEKNGVQFETGPNVILLSDVMIQNGAFCNLAEFPVLQMLYRQGLILPNHPNNNGSKPLIVGAPAQVRAQLQYIYRGNYGLISEEEIAETGIGPDLARDMMRLKLKFAFGKIRPPGDLLESREIEADPVEIRSGVYLKRVALNRFEFSYGGEIAEVDLNLRQGETYESPYPLGSHQIKREYFAVIHCGEGDGWDINRPSMGSILMYQGRIYLVDAGPNILASLMALGIGVNEIEGIFHTHSHDDHFAGLTTLIRSDHRLKYYAVPMVRASVAKKMAALLAMEEEGFADYFDVRDLTLDVWNDIEGLEVRPIFSPHPVETTIFTFRSLGEGGYKSYAHFADIASKEVLEGFVTEEPCAPGMSREWRDRVLADYLAPADVKKLDIGGGLIHGMARDFAQDESKKIILAHTARKFTAEEKAIGSGAPFGTVDVLIPSHQDFAWRTAHGFLVEAFPGLPSHHIRVLLNNQIVSFNPETILMQEGEQNREMYLILAGIVEMVAEERATRNLLSAGALVGELTGLFGMAPMETYRAASFVRALKLPCDLYTEFVKRHDLFPGISAVLEYREFLKDSWLFGEMGSTGTLNRIAKSMRSAFIQEGELLEPGLGMVSIIKSGAAERRIGTKRIESLGAGDFFGEEGAVFEMPSLSRLIATDTCEIFRLPASLLKDIPSVRWKLFETYQRRLRQAAAAGGGFDAAFAWKEEYGIGVARIDNQHRRLVEMAGSVAEAMRAGRGRETVMDALDFLLGYTMFHFSEEEEMLARYGYPERDDHKQKHRQLLEQARQIGEKVSASEGGAEHQVLGLLRDWILGHILIEDRKFACFLNDKGVY